MMCRDKEGDIVTQQSEILQRWTEFFKEKFEKNGDPLYDGIILDQTDTRETNPPSVTETQEAVTRLKNNKSPGLDNISAELIKEGGDSLLNAIHELIVNIWNNKQLPQDWNTGIIIPLHKKGDQLQCKNYRAITLLTVAYKILSNIVYERLRPYAEEIVGGYQCGFCRQKSTIDQIFVLRQILEKTTEFNIDTYHLFIDFESAYDSIHREFLIHALKEFNIPTQLIDIVKETLKVQSKIRIQNALTDTIHVRTGLRQGDALSCILFNITLEKIIRESKVNTRGTIITKSVQILAFADDVDIIARSEREMIEAFHAIERAAQNSGLNINEIKTKYMKASKSTGQRNLQNLTIGDYNIESVKNFTYLGSLVTADNNVGEEVKRRIHMANKTYNGLIKHLRSNNITRKTKCKIYKTLIKPVLVYGSETWTLSKSDENLLGTFERKILRHIYKGVKENDVWRRRYNFELYAAYNEPDVITSIKIGRLRWMGHVERMLETETPKHIMRQTPVGRRSKGRPKLRYMEQVEQDLKTLKITHWKDKARNRTEWRKILEQAKTQKGLSSY